MPTRAASTDPRASVTPERSTKLAANTVYMLVNTAQGTVPIRSEHAALNTLLQSAGAIICKRWVVELDRMLQESEYEYGKDYAQVAFVHDEVQMLVREGIENEIGNIAVRAIGVAGDTYKFRIPLTGEFRYGANWSATH